MAAIAMKINPVPCFIHSYTIVLKKKGIFFFFLWRDYLNTSLGYSCFCGLFGFIHHINP